VKRGIVIVLATVRRLVPCVLVCLLVLLSIGASAQEEESYSVQLDGRKTWTLRWGLGDALGLGASGLTAGQLSLDQTLAVDISGAALSILSVEAHFDDRQADSLQSLAITLDTERLDGVLGDFVADGIGGFAAYGKKMKGLRLEYTLGDAVVTGIASKLEGISESKTYVGQKAHDEITYSAYSTADPPKPRPYKRGIAGLYAYPLSTFYVEEFSEVRLSYDVAEGLRSVLAEYGLDYLFDVLIENESFALEEWEYQVIEDEQQTLLLSEDAVDLVRDRLEAAIELYNEANDLSEEDAKEYPFSRGTAYEQGFLETVATHVFVSVDAEKHPILDAERRRFYDLGREGIVIESLSVEVSPDGVTFDLIASPAYAEYGAVVFPEAGILEVDFPQGFFTDESAIRVNFDYTVSGGVFMLGLSIIPGSDRVSVNDAPLKRDVDYMIDYEIGMLILLIVVEETDVVRVDYERFAGGIFGGAADYATYFYGLTLDWPISEQLTIQASLLQSAEDPGSVSDPNSVKTMPNRHTVAGISGAISLDELDADFLVAYSDDRFPFDDNARVNQPNEIASIAATKDYVLFGHRSGLTVKRDGEWITYGTSHGLAGRSIQAIAVGDETLFLGTNSGLTVVSLDGLSPLDRVGNWTNYYADEERGLPSASVTALFFADGVLWVGTDAGLTSVRLDDIDELEAWVRFDEDVELGEVSALAGDGGTLFVGTENGLYQHSLITGKWGQMQGSEGVRIHDLSLSDGTLYVASSRGLRSYRDGIGTGWLVLGETIYAVEAADGLLVFGTERGLVDAGTGEVVVAGEAATALGMVDDLLWVGTRADADYQLTIWAYGGPGDSYGPGVTGIDGRDPFGFIDAVAEEHTTVGFIERASFRHATDGFTLLGTFGNLSPSYRSIGSLSRSESTGWDLAGTWDLGADAQLSASHEYDIVGRPGGEPAATTVNDLSLQWTFGPVLTLNAHQKASYDEAGHDGPESTYTSYQFSLSDRLFAERLDLGFSWSDGYTWSYELGDPRRETRLSLNVKARILPSWSAQLNWGRPIRSDDGEWSGSESLALQTGWSGGSPGVDFAVDYALGWKREVPGGTGSRDHELDLDVDVVSFEASGWQITPGATFAASSDESSLDVDGRLTARGRRGDLSIQGTLRGGLSGLGEPVVREDERLSLTASYSGIEGLRPSLSYSIDRQVAIYEAQRQQTIDHSVTGRMTWSPAEGHYDELSFSLSADGAAEDRRITARIENSYRLDLQEWMGSWWSDTADEWTYPALDLRVDTDVNYRRIAEDPDIDATTTGRLNVAFSPTWSGSFGVTYLGGTGSTGTFYHSLLLELTVAIDF
jgi:hypothetical protein